MEKIYIKKSASISPLGTDENEIWNHYSNPNTFIQKYPLKNEAYWMGKIPSETEQKLNHWITQHNYHRLDRSVQLALWTADQLIQNSKNKLPENTGVNLGSSRGATQLFEQYFSDFIHSEKTHVMTSPTTSLGNLSSWVGQHLGTHGIAFSHSMTCSTSLLSILNAIAWLESEMVDTMIVGGTEAPLTPFTIAQLKALRIYSDEKEIPCRATDDTKTANTMVLGEAAALFWLSKKSERQQDVMIKGYGISSEKIHNPVSISNDAQHLQQSMKMALLKADLETVDVVITHTPGTIKGDNAELKAVEKVFGQKQPKITNNKWKIGHTFGASGAMSVDFALKMIENQTYIPTPFSEENMQLMSIKNIMINAAGFGGNAVSVIVGREG